MHDRYGPKDLYADLKFASEIDPDPVHWLWPARIPLAKLTLLIRPTLDDAWAWTTQRPDNEDDHVGGARK